MTSFMVLTCLLALSGQVYMAALPQYLVEVLFFIDDAVVQKYIEIAGGDERSVEAKIVTDANYFISEINKIFENIEGLSIGIEKRDLIFMGKDIVKGPNVERDAGLETFDKWRKEEGTNDHYKQDIAVFWTGFELVRGGNPATAGYANVGKVCDAPSASLIAEFDMTYNTVVVTAHEIGHVLGSGHDQDTLRRVMGAEAFAGSPNRWAFSKESVDSITDTIKALATNCLTETDPNSKIVDAESPNELADPDTICRRSQKDKNSYMSKSHLLYEMQPPHGDLICKAIYCYGGAPDDYRAAYASDGMICGKSKRCHEGKCVDQSDPESDAASDDCVFGDQKHIDMASFTGTCDQLIEKFGTAVCYGFKSACCTTCNKAKSDDPKCEYGDKSRKCKGKEQYQVCGKSAATCCALCKSIRRINRLT